MSCFRCLLAMLATFVAVGDFDSNRCLADDDVAPINLVGEAAAVCLEVPRFESTWSRFLNSRLAARLKVFPPVERFLGGAAFQKWTLVEEHVRRSTGNSLSEHLLGAFSDSLVVAVYLPDGRPPEGIVIARARDEAALNKALRAWDTLEPQHDSQAKEHQGHAYVRRAKSASSTAVVYHTTFGQTIALSDHERLIHQVIEFHAAAKRKAAGTDGDAVAPRLLRDLALYQSNRIRMPVESSAFLFVNSRQWDRVVDAAVGQSPDAAWVRPLFQHVAAVSVSLRLDDEAVVTVVADTSGMPTPAGWQRFVAATNGGADWHQRIPADAIAAISSRLEVGPLVRAWLANHADAKTGEFARGRNLLKSVLLGRDLFDDMLPQILRDWTVALVPADAAVADLSPLDVIGRFSLKGNEKLAAHHPPLEKSLDNAIQFGLTFLGAVLSHQRGASGTDPVLVETEASAAGTVRSLTGLRPWTPVCLLAPQQLTLATSRRALSNNRNPSPESTPDRNSRLATCEKRYFRATTQLVWVDLARLRSLLTQQGDWIAGQLAPDSTDNRQRVLKHLSKSEEAARVFDAAFFAVRFDDDHVRIVFGAALDPVE